MVGEASGSQQSRQRRLLSQRSTWSPGAYRMDSVSWISCKTLPLADCWFCSCLRISTLLLPEKELLCWRSWWMSLSERERPVPSYL